MLTQAENNAGSFKYSTPQEIRKIVTDSEDAIKTFTALIDRLEIVRNKALAYLDPEFIFNPEPFRLIDTPTIDETEKLFKAIWEIINKIQGALKNSEIDWDIISQDKWSIDDILNLIEKGREADIKRAK